MYARAGALSVSGLVVENEPSEVTSPFFKDPRQLLRERQIASMRCTM